MSERGAGNCSTLYTPCGYWPTYKTRPLFTLSFSRTFGRHWLENASRILIEFTYLILKIIRTQKRPLVTLVSVLSNNC